MRYSALRPGTWERTLASILNGPYDELFEMARGVDATGGSTGLFAPRDPELLGRLLMRFLEDPLERSAVRNMLGPDYEGSLDALALGREIAWRVSRGEVVLRHVLEARRSGILPGITVGGDGEIIEIHASQEELEEKIRDFWFECEHHAAPDGERGQEGRQLFHKGELNQVTRVQVVPTVGTTVDKIKLHWKDEYLGNPPRSEVIVSCSGQDDVSVGVSGGQGGYATYEIDAHYHEDIDMLAFILPSFWTRFNAVTTHSVSRGPAPLTVVVHNPRKFKFEFAMPPLRSYKRGYKLGAESGDVRQLAKPSNLTKKVEEERAGWGPPSVPLPDFAKPAAAKYTTSSGSQERETAGHGTPSGAWEKKDASAEHGSTGAAIKGAANKAHIDTLRLTRDDWSIDPPNALATIAELLRFYRLISGIIKTIKDYAPQTGFYLDFDLQLFQGGLAVEWMYKEWENHEAFLAWDVNLKVSVLKVTLELGVGVGAAGFKLQVFAQLTGELSIEGGYKRERPNSVGGFQLPTIKGKITGAIGARAEAGGLAKLEGKGETAFDLEMGFGINLRSKPVTADGRVRWTGLWFTGTFSAGLMGVSYTKTAKCDVCGPSAWWGLSWPNDTPYRPPTMSRAAIAAVFTKVLTRSWDIRVFDSRDNHIAVRDVANMLADRVLEDRGFDKTPDDMEALANSVRMDLDVLGDRWGRDWILLSDLSAYLTGTVKGVSMLPHLAAGQSDPLLT